LQLNRNTRCRAPTGPFPSRRAGSANRRRGYRACDHPDRENRARHLRSGYPARSSPRRRRSARRRRRTPQREHRTRCGGTRATEQSACARSALLSHHSHPGRRNERQSLYGRSKRNLPRDFRRGRPAEAQVPFRCSKHRIRRLFPVGRPGSASLQCRPANNRFEGCRDLNRRSLPENESGSLNPEQELPGEPALDLLPHRSLERRAALSQRKDQSLAGGAFPLSHNQLVALDVESRTRRQPGVGIVHRRPAPAQ
jgi:hypothetical protein